MKLIGSTTSPFVRKVILVLEDLGIPYKLEQVTSITPDGAKKIGEHNAARRIPILETEDGSVFDSTIICEYLLEKQGKQLDIQTKLALRLIDELCDSCIILFQQKLWKCDPNWESKFSQVQFERVKSILASLEKKVDKGGLHQMEKDWLFCVLDWLSFREVFNWKKGHLALENFYESLKDKKRYQKSAPRA
ncbi:glutathione S-transferase family protein [Halobacteriovorax sp. ZH5_bin.2]|uniref:glutathione S-transferase family protein n=1 Tax=unclassified Halobacteriovorax TaxID=2639665 RepID=UPI0037107F92